MGILDWLTEGLGSDMGGSSMPPLPQADNLPTMPMPPPQSMEMGPRPVSADGLVAPPSHGRPGPRDPSMTDIAGGMQGTGPQPYPAGTDPMTAGGPPPLPPGGDPMTADQPQSLDPMTAGGAPSPGLPPPRPPYPPGTDPMTAGGAPGNGPGLPPGMPVPTPQPRPPGADAGPNMSFSDRPKTSFVPNQPPGPPMQIAPNPGTTPPNAASQSFIGRALGLDRNKERGMFESLAGGLTAAGNSKGKGKGQALFSGAGGALEGGNKADKEISAEQDRLLGRQIASKVADNAAATGATNRELNAARTQLALAQAKQAMVGGKESVVNSPEQLYLRAQSAASQDGRLKALKTAADQAAIQFGANSEQAKAAQKAHKEAYDATVEGHAKTLGLDPGKLAKIGKQPGMSQDNPMKLDGATQEQIDRLPVGAFIIGPDGKVLVKQPPKQPAAGANPQAPAQQMAPPVPPVPVTAPAGTRADTSDDED
jgi:hypothetical protein